MGDFENVIHCSIGTLLIFFAFTTCQSVTAEAAVQNGYGSQGFYTLSALYFTFGVASLVLVEFISKIGSRKSMILASIFYFQWVLCGLVQVLFEASILTRIIITLSAIICGVGSSLFWVGQGKYIADCSNDRNKGFHNGLALAFFSFSTIIGHLSGAILVKYFSYTIFLLVMSMFSLMGMICFYTLKDPIHKEQILTELSDLSENGVHEEKTAASTVPSLKDTLYAVFDKKMLKFICYIIPSSFIFCVYASFLTKLICNATFDVEERFANSLFCMTVAGIGQTLGSSIAGKIIDMFDNKTGVFVSFLVEIVTAISTCFVLDMGEFGVAWIVISFMWGFTRTFHFTLLNCMCGFEFTNQIQAFGIMKCIQQLFSGTILFLLSFIKEVDQIFEQKSYFITIVFLSIIAGIVMTSFPFLEKKKNIQKVISINESILSS